MTHVTARARVNDKGHGITGGIVHNDNAFACYGRTASRMTVAETNVAFEAAKRRQQGK